MTTIAFWIKKAIQEKLSFFDDIQVKFYALNGAELLFKLDTNHNLDVLLMDIDMPILNGIEATAIVNKNILISKSLC